MVGLVQLLQWANGFIKHLKIIFILNSKMFVFSCFRVYFTVVCIRVVNPIAGVSRTSWLARSAGTAG